MHEMRLLRSRISVSVSLSVCLSSAGWLCMLKTAKQMEVRFGVETLGDPRNTRLHASIFAANSMRLSRNYFGHSFTSATDILSCPYAARSVLLQHFHPSYVALCNPSLLYNYILLLW